MDKLPLEGGAVHTPPGKPPRQPRARQGASENPRPVSRSGPSGPDRPEADLFTYVPPERRTHLNPEEAPLLLVSNRAFTEADTTDAWLYLLVGHDEGEELMREGLRLDARAPLLLTERSGVFALLEAQSQDMADDTHETPALLLRARKSDLAPWIEADPDMSARLGVACYLLSRQTPSG
ncbi:hypothetical protein [Asaia krungthepensis]|nr:hypothetical protein [Asaia krungthepensis]